MFLNVHIPVSRILPLCNTYHNYFSCNNFEWEVETSGFDLSQGSTDSRTQMSFCCWIYWSVLYLSRQWCLISPRLYCAPNTVFPRSAWSSGTWCDDRIVQYLHGLVWPIGRPPVHAAIECLRDNWEMEFLILFSFNKLTLKCLQMARHLYSTVLHAGIGWKKEK